MFAGGRIDLKVNTNTGFIYDSCFIQVLLLDSVGICSNDSLPINQPSITTHSNLVNLRSLII